MIRILTVAALAAFAILISGCEDPGNVGGSFLEDDANLESRSISVGSVEEFKARGYTGRLRYMAIGRYDDPLFGEMTSIGIVKPSIDTTNIGSTVAEDETMLLRLVFSSSVYGDTTSSADFEIYRLTDNWRGNEVRIGDQLAIDQSSLVGQFSVSGNETVEVELDRSWVEEYNEYLALEGGNRETIYRNEFPGLAIVPAGNSSKILFANIRPATGDDDSNLNFVRFVIDNGEDEDNGENGDDDNDNGDDSRIFQRLFDWSALQNRSEPADNPQGYMLHNTLDNMLQIDPELTEERIVSKNLANVQLVLYQNRDLLESSLPAGHVRPEVTQARIHIIETGPVHDRVFTHAPEFGGEFDSADNSLRFNLTNFANTALFDTPPAGDFYLSLETQNGLLFSTLIFDENAPEELRPKILISSVKTGRE